MRFRRSLASLLAAERREARFIIGDMSHSDLLAGLSPTPLNALPRLAERLGLRAVFVKAENCRLLGNFKSLGGMHAAAKALARIDGTTPDRRVARTLLCASDGNHGLAVAAAARAADVAACVYLPRHVRNDRAARILEMGATVIRVEGTYDDAVSQAKLAADRGEGILIADTTEDTHDIVVADVMTGYARIAEEIIAQLQAAGLPAPTHLFAQAGVGGFAAAMALGLAPVMAEPRRVVVVEPATAACVAAALAHGAPIRIDGTLETCADMLSCGVASAPALEILLRYETVSIQVAEDMLREACAVMGLMGGPSSTPSGAAGLAGLVAGCRNSWQRRRLGIDGTSVVLLFATEAVAIA